MNNITHLGFSLKVEIHKIDSVKVTKAGSYNGNDYPDSLTLRTTLMTTEEDLELGLKDREQILDIKIPTENKEDAKNLNRAIRSHDFKRSPLYLDVPIPVKVERKDIFDVFAISSIKDIFEQLKVVKAS